MILIVGDVMFGLLAIVGGLMAILGVSYFKILGPLSRFFIAGVCILFAALILSGVFVLQIGIPLGKDEFGNQRAYLLPDWTWGLILAIGAFIWIFLPSFLSMHPFVKYVLGGIVLLLGVGLIFGWWTMALPTNVGSPVPGEVGGVI